jgi:Rieske 2Fe-2S family protein
MSKKVSRRDFAKTSVVAGAAAAIPGALVAQSPVTKVANGKKAGPKQPQGGSGQQSAASAGRAAWSEGHTIPAEYYIDEKRFIKDEQYVGDHFWLIADHESRIPNPGDYFTFAFGRGESVIVLRDKASQVKAYYNVCRHRGSRLCRHEDEPPPNDARLSVKQLNSTGNTPIFRCPYHAWTYDIDGRLIAAYGMPDDFQFSENGLQPCHVRTAEGFIFLNFSRDKQPPDFESDVRGVRTIGQRYGTAGLKIGARIHYPTKANWKLALENFLECYHCGPAHRSLVTTHDWDYSISKDQKARREPEIDKWVPPDVRPGRFAPPSQQSGGQQQGGGMGQAGGESVVNQGWLMPGFLTGSLDGKPVAPLLPNFKEYTHGFREAVTSWSTGYWAAYDDYVAVARFIPRGVASTDAEIIWLVNSTAVEGKDYTVERLTALWDITMREDKWIVENNHQGITCGGGYRSGRYATHEVGRTTPGAFIKWYMTEVVRAV